MTIKDEANNCIHKTALRSLLPCGVRPKLPFSAIAGTNEVTKKAG